MIDNRQLDQMCRDAFRQRKLVLLVPRKYEDEVGCMRTRLMPQIGGNLPPAEGQQCEGYSERNKAQCRNQATPGHSYCAHH